MGGGGGGNGWRTCTDNILNDTIQWRVAFLGQKPPTRLYSRKLPLGIGTVNVLNNRRNG